MDNRYMEITEKDIEEFRSLYRKKFNKVIDSTTARKKLTMLIRQMEILYQPITSDQIEELARQEAKKVDAVLLAELIYDIYQDQKNSKHNDKTSKS